jgi:hypothetical protein
VKLLAPPLHFGGNPRSMDQMMVTPLRRSLGGIIFVDVHRSRRTRGCLLEERCCF